MRKFFAPIRANARRHLCRGGLAAAIALACLMPGPLLAQSGQVFDVQGIKVDATAESAAEAREIAVREGSVAALDKLMRKLLPAAEYARIADFDPTRIQPLILGFAVEEERTSAVRYLGTLGYSFRPDAVRAMMRRYGLSYSETAGPRLVVLPVLGEGAGAQLWEEGNLWRTAWSRGETGHGLLPLVAPLGDLSDVSLIGAQDALALDLSRIGALASRYGATGGLVTQARLSGSAAAGGARLTVISREVGTERAGVWEISLNQEPGEEAGDFFLRAALAAEQRIQEDWKSNHLVQAGREETAPMTIWSPGLGDWLSIRAILAETPLVTDVTLIRLTRKAAQAKVTYVGSSDRLTTTLRGSGLNLYYDTEFGWLLHRTGSQPDLNSLRRMRGGLSGTYGSGTSGSGTSGSGTSGSGFYGSGAYGTGSSTGTTSGGGAYGGGAYGGGAAPAVPEQGTVAAPE